MTISNSGGYVGQALPSAMASRTEVFSTSPSSALATSGHQREGFASLPSVDAPAPEQRGVTSFPGAPECSVPPSPRHWVTAGAARSHEQDYRIAAHEAGHIVLTRANGSPVCGATITPGQNYGGVVWGSPAGDPSEMHFSVDDDVESIEQSRLIERNMKPPVGETNDWAPHIYRHVFNRVVELMAGSAAEIVMHPDADLLCAASDLTKARALAAIICATETSIDAFLVFALKEAIGVIERYRHVAQALAQALIERRTIDGDQIEAIIHTSDVAKAAADECKRRKAWNRVAAGVSANAGRFQFFERPPT